MKFPTMITDDSITVVVDGKPLAIKRGNVNFLLVLDELKKGDNADEARLVALMDVRKAITAYTSGNIEVRDGKILYKGREQHNTIVDRIFTAMKEGLDHTPMINCMDKLLQNPSSRSVQELMRFMEHGFMPITPEGNVQSYKGLGSDDYSVFGDPNAPLLQGKMDAGGHILNTVGETIEVERNYVNDDFRNGCGRGLHSGSYAYAESWGNGNMVLVEWNPADAVSVPDCSSHQKLRVCKYKVVSIVTPVGPLRDVYSVRTPVAEDLNNTDAGWSEHLGDEECPDCGEYFDEGVCDDDNN